MTLMSPNQPKTAVRGVRIPDALWSAAQAEAKLRGESVSDAVRVFLQGYARGEGRLPTHGRGES